MTKLIAFHGQQAIKDKYFARVRAHKAADEIIHGVYWQKGKGCAVGCTVHSADHSAYESELGIPQILARLEDGIFESLNNGRSKEWPEQFLSVIPVGGDLSMVWPKFAVWLLVDKKYGVIQFTKHSETKKAIQDIANAYQGIVDGKTEAVDWRKLRRAAAAAADAYAARAAYAAADAAAADADADAYAAYAAADADAAYAARAAAYAARAAAADADAYAAYAAADADAAYAAYAAYAAAADDVKRQEWHIAQADKLLELMAEVPVISNGS